MLKETTHLPLISIANRLIIFFQLFNANTTLLYFNILLTCLFPDETDSTKKEVLRSKIQQYLDRVEYLKKVIEGSWKKPDKETGLGHLVEKRPDIKPLIEQLTNAQRAKEENRLNDSLKLYQSGLEGLLAVLPTATEEEHKLLRAEINTNLRAAEDVRTLRNILSSKKEADFDLERPSSNSSKFDCSIQ
eukprot:m.31877 g.31877  ORF g.31877 m.31877 type:complete len:189 (+) comp31568_c0_seq5:1162-1728(+)